MTKPRTKTFEELTAEIEDGKKKIRQFENRENVASEVIQRGTQNAQPPPYRPGRSL